MRHAWEVTGGRFDPTVGPAMEALGYSTSWPHVGGPAHLPAPRAAPGCAGVMVEASVGLVQVPAGVRFDPGGVGKGLAADLTAGELIGAGADGVLVNIGGDLCVHGEAPDGTDAWTIDVEHPYEVGRAVARIVLAEGGVATSTSARRHWRTGDGVEIHHVVEPRTGLPAASRYVQATVVAGSAWWAEVLATAAFLDGDLADPAAAALLIDQDGSLRSVGADAEEWFRPAQEVVG
jgi:thiamine biosynthesis lipoprotein